MRANVEERVTRCFDCEDKTNRKHMKTINQITKKMFLFLSQVRVTNNKNNNFWN